MTEGNREENAAMETKESKESQPSGSQGKTWYPYITKTQFEKFLSRLESKFPEQIDRDYIRAIIRTPSMIYRFLRGIEAMKLIDREQKPTARLERLVAQQSRRHTIAEILRDLYADLLERWQQNEEKMSDDDMVAFFRSRTGMGRDSANKMKMFYKYLVGEADFSEPAPARPKPGPRSQEAPAPPPAPEPPQEKRPGRDGGRDSRPAPAPAPPRNGPQYAERPQRGLSEMQKAYLQTLQSIVRINIDGDWDDDLIRAAFDRLERLFDRIKRG